MKFLNNVEIDGSLTVGGTNIKNQLSTLQTNINTVSNTVNTVSANANKIKTYVGSDGKLHFTNASGADTALNFSSGEPEIYFSDMHCSWYSNDKSMTSTATIIAPKTGRVKIYCAVTCRNIYNITKGTLSGFDGQIEESLSINTVNNTNNTFKYNGFLVYEADVVADTEYTMSIKVAKTHISSVAFLMFYI